MVAANWSAARSDLHELRERPMACCVHTLGMHGLVPAHYAVDRSDAHELEG